MLCCKIVRNPLPQRLGFSQLSYRCKWLTRAKDPVSEVPPSQELNPNWKKLAVSLFLCGSISGPLLDSIHSRTQLQIYDSLPVDLSVFNLEFHSSIWVSPLLGTFYVVLGGLHLWLDRIYDPDRPVPSWGFVALNFGSLALGIEISAWMYENGYPYLSIHAVLAVYAFVNWLIFEKTLHGALLASFIAIGAPLCETPILLWLKWWHYPQPDVFGLIPSWVIWCYFFYTPAVANLSRKLSKKAVSP